MGFFGFLALLVALWLLWNVSRNTADALDKHTALQYELAALEKQLNERFDQLNRTLKSGDVMVNVEAFSGQPEVSGQDPSGEHNKVSEATTDSVNINTASMTDLIKLPKIGKAIAQRIIAGRPYAAVDDLHRVQGITDDMIGELSERLRV